MMDQPNATTSIPSLKGQVRGTRLGGSVQVVETWFDDEPISREGIDVWISHQRSRPISSRGWLYFYSIHVDLSPAPELIQKNMHPRTFQEIRKTEAKDGLSCYFNETPTEEDINNYNIFYDKNPRTGDQRALDKERLKDLNKAGLLNLAKVSDAQGEDLTWHCLLCHERLGVVQIYSSASLFHRLTDKSMANAVGRANRWLHYREFLFYKERGFRIYDLNGWYAGIDDKKRLNINQFKEGFGGSILFGFDCEEALSLRGRIYLLLRGLNRRLFHIEQQKEIYRRREKAPRLSTV